MRYTKLFEVESFITQFMGETAFAKQHYKLGTHLGVDLVPIDRHKTDEHWTLFTPMWGKVMQAGLDGPYGNSIIIYNPDKRVSLHFAHLDKIFVNKGQDIPKEYKIGVGGNTGNSTARHVHLGYIPMSPFGNRLFVNNPYLGCMDPVPFLMELGVHI